MNHSEAPITSPPRGCSAIDRLIPLENRAPDKRRRCFRSRARHRLLFAGFAVMRPSIYDTQSGFHRTRSAPSR